MGSKWEAFRELATSRNEKLPILLKYRSSSLFIILTVCVAVFTDIFLYAVIVPVIPFALEVRVGVPSDNGIFSLHFPHACL